MSAHDKDGFPLTAIREINVLLSFHHPNIVNVSEVVVGGRNLDVFMVMEFMEHDLKELMEAMDRFLTIAEVRRCQLHTRTPMLDHCSAAPFSPFQKPRLWFCA